MTNLFKRLLQRDCSCATHAAVALSVLSFCISGAAFCAGSGCFSCKCKKSSFKEDHSERSSAPEHFPAGNGSAGDTCHPGAFNGTCGCEPITAPEDLPRT